MNKKYIKQNEDNKIVKRNYSKNSDRRILYPSQATFYRKNYFDFEEKSLKSFSNINIENFFYESISNSKVKFNNYFYNEKDNYMTMLGIASYINECNSSNSLIWQKQIIKNDYFVTFEIKFLEDIKMDSSNYKRLHEIFSLYTNNKLNISENDEISYYEIKLIESEIIKNDNCIWSESVKCCCTKNNLQKNKNALQSCCNRKRIFFYKDIINKENCFILLDTNHHVFTKHYKSHCLNYNFKNCFILKNNNGNIEVQRK